MFIRPAVVMHLSFAQFSIISYKFWRFDQKKLNYGFIVVLGLIMKVTALESYPKTYGYVELIVIIFVSATLRE